jgi:hypothetical protein
MYNIFSYCQEEILIILKKNHIINKKGRTAMALPSG